MSIIIFKEAPMQPVMVRMPSKLREKAKQLAAITSKSEGRKYTESDIYRTAIQIFLDRNFTDSTENGG